MGVGSFVGYDGTRLSYHVVGEGAMVVCLPGGPMSASEYLGELGGLAGRVRLVRLDLRGTGESGMPSDVGSYRCDRLVDDVEGLREALGVAELNVLGHSAGGNLAVLYAARFPERVRRLVLICPSAYAVGIVATAEDRRAVLGLRAGEPWFGEASAAFERIAAGEGGAADWEALAPAVHGRWDEVARAHYAAGEKLQNVEAAGIFGSEGAYDPEVTRAALGRVTAPVLAIAGEFDTNSPPPLVTGLAGLFPNATQATLPGAGHFPWLDNPARLTEAISAFLR